MSNVLIDGLNSVFPYSDGQVRIINKSLDSLTVGTVIVLLPMYDQYFERRDVTVEEQIAFVPLSGGDTRLKRYAHAIDLNEHSIFTGVMVGAGWTAESVWGALAQLSEPVQLALGLIEDERGEKPAVSRFRGEGNA